ncbi:MAG TPA: malectin domain-containing carbohydrate-binding protein [Candidatus Paceibacterota bacterium]|nr:malectin domain-containing carbohydrate-binding protein [Verrucomicrobiota bacterium]HSA11396.1 malectin domain-containing carbohydrate-binding protein [Candidatus Paceibacterota bacterium]
MRSMRLERFACAILLCGLCLPAPAQSLSGSKLSAHLINACTPGSSIIIAGKPRVLKVLALDSGFPSGMVQAMRDYKASAPAGKVVVRVYTPKSYSLANDATASALDFWTTVLQPSLNSISASDRALIDYLEGPNEGDTPTLGYPTSPAGAASHWFNQFWTNLTPLIVSAGYKPCVGSIAVGNPGSLADLDPFVPALRQAQAAGGAWSYHAYTIQYTTDAGVEHWYSLRYRQFYSYFAQQGYSDLLNLPLILTEGGVDQSGTPATSGWQARGTAAQYERWLNWFDRQMSQDSCVLGCTLFQNGDPAGWSSFDLEPIAGWFGNYLAGPSTWPSPPAGVAAAAAGGAVLLTWTNAPLTPVAYAVKRATNSGGPYTLLGQNLTEGMPLTAFTDDAPVHGATNYYVVTAVNAVAESDNSVEVPVGIGLFAAAPAAPSALTAAAGPGNITLNWTAPANAASFNVKRSTTSDGAYTVIAGNVSAPPFYDTSCAVGTPYYYYVSAVNNAGESTDSNQAVATPTNALPDVVVTAIAWTPAAFYPGNNVLFTATVKNQGSAPAPGNGETIGIGFNVDGVGGFWSGGYTGPLAPGASVNLAASGGSNGGYWPATPGAHTVTAHVDDINRFPEGSEDNNLFTAAFETSISNYSFNCGGPAVGGFNPDAPYTSSLSTRAVTNAIDLSAATYPAPQAVYQSERWRGFTTILPGLLPGKLYKARLHFAEISPSVTAPGDRQFNVALNGVQVLANFDVLAAAGAKFRATTRQFNVAADSAGRITLQFSRGAAFEPACSGLEIFPYTNTAPILAAIPNRTVNAGGFLTFTNTAADADLPPDILTFSLLAGPAGAALSADGVFSWTAPQLSTPQTNNAAIRVTDNGTPPLAAARAFKIVVIPPPRFASCLLSNLAPVLTWSTYPGRTYRLLYKDDLSAPAWTPLGLDTVASDSLLSGTDTNAAGSQRFYRVLQLN